MIKDHLLSPAVSVVDVVKREYKVRDDPHWPAPETIEELDRYREMLTSPATRSIMFEEMINCLVDAGESERNLLRVPTDVTYALFENLGKDAYKKWWDAMRYRLPIDNIKNAYLE